MKSKKILAGIFIAALFSVIYLSCGKSSTSSSASPNAVTIQGMAFNPATITVEMGTTVTWTNRDAMDHTVTSDNGTSFNSGPVTAGGGVFSFTTNAVGTFPYHCTIHPTMHGTLVVTTAP